MPNKNHRNVPIVNKLYIDNEMPDVFLVLMVCNACGKKDAVVQIAAIKPMVVDVML